MQEITYDVPGVSCEHCINSITKATKELGVDQVQVDLPSKKVFVAFDAAKLSETQVKEAIEEEGYDVTGQASGNGIPSIGKKSLNLKSL